jgi:hypothetical protein
LILSSPSHTFYISIKSQNTTTMWARLIFMMFLALSPSSNCSAQQAGDDYGGGGGGDYYDQGAGGGGADDYAQDNLYHDYALRQQEKAVGGAA